MQKVVRTGLQGSNEELRELLKYGYKVAMCNQVGNELEYIVEADSATDLMAGIDKEMRRKAFERAKQEHWPLCQSGGNDIER
ncbi:MAG TPA: hypothetical protein DGR27_05215 [Eubacterium sp.]|nr:MAG TPA: hypothetical protein [Caudoviricetes sp.]HAS70603.1 hypothetical protein [Eubacterium sp.]HCW37900.1 hypothetical protein [Eubacterium sp.]